MRVFVGFLELLDGVVRIDLRGGKGSMPQKLLHGIQVGTVVEQVGGEGVTQHVRTAFGEVRIEVQTLFHNLIDRGTRYGRSSSYVRRVHYNSTYPLLYHTLSNPALSPNP